MVEQTSAELANAVGVLWTVQCTVLIFLMQVGFAMLEAGSVRLINRKSALLKNLLDVFITFVSWHFIGSFIARGNYSNSPSLSASAHVEESSTWIVDVMFAASSVTIPSGAVLERMSVAGYLASSFVLASVAFPIVVRCAWADGGFLREWGFTDFAGSSVVHVFGGTVGLVLAYWVGPRRHYVKRDPDAEEGTQRIGKAMMMSTELTDKQATQIDFAAFMRYTHHLEKRIKHVEEEVLGDVPRSRSTAWTCRFDHPERDAHTFRPCSPSLVVLGTLMLWVGWYGFNIGSVRDPVRHPGLVARIMWTTSLAAAGGQLMGVLLLMRLQLTPRLRLGLRPVPQMLSVVCNSTLAGLASVCAQCHAVSGTGAFIVGMCGALSAFFVSKIVERRRIDDVIDAGAVHFGGGLAGTLLTGAFTLQDADLSVHVFAQPRTASTTFAVQLSGAILIALWAGLLTTVLCIALRFFRVLRTSEVIEELGFDVCLQQSLQPPEGDNLLEALPNILPKSDGHNMMLQRLQLWHDVGLVVERCLPRVVCVSRIRKEKGKSVDALGGYLLDLIQKSGATPIVLPYKNMTVERLLEFLPMDGLIVLGVNDVSEQLVSKYSLQTASALETRNLQKVIPKEELELALAHFAMKMSCPLLGLCQGSQLINALRGGHIAGGIRLCQTHSEPVCDEDDFEEVVASRCRPLVVESATPMAEWFDDSLCSASSLQVDLCGQEESATLGPGFLKMAMDAGGIIKAFYDHRYNPDQGQFIVGMEFCPHDIVFRYLGCTKVFTTFASACRAKKKTAPQKRAIEKIEATNL
eukprot:TRINITY_DN31042_c0_g1_i1.p1 TRINITY_DN31042_c0_g1~~TRINITY_DN31042_c0_g1_i1.p1  ORF type:complete len:818 (+),score=96.75 TRINITY_DN31042_c0_g1_i1:43-2454(+)